MKCIQGLVSETYAQKVRMTLAPRAARAVAPVDVDQSVGLLGVHGVLDVLQPRVHVHRGAGAAVLVGLVPEVVSPDVLGQWT